MTTAAVIALSLSQVQASGAVSGRDHVARHSAQAGQTAVDALPKTCPDARKGLRYYRSVKQGWDRKRAISATPRKLEQPRTCKRARELAKLARKNAHQARKRYEAWREYHWNWPAWLPDKWARIGACETGYGQRPGRWDWNSGTYQGAFGFYHGSWDAFAPRADPKAGPYPSEAYLATPRQQYEVALAIYRMYGLSGWGCRGA